MHSRRTVLTKCSVCVFVRGACGGVRITSMPTAVKTASKPAVNFASRSRSRNRKRVGALVELRQQVAGLLEDPGAGRVRGDTDDVDPAAGRLQEEEDVDPSEEHCVDCEAVAGDDREGLGGEELLPGRAGPSGRRVDTGARCSIFHPVPAVACRRSLASSPWMWRCP